MTDKPKILITNDDGIHAPGLRLLWQALKEIATLYIVAPSKEQSGAASGISINKTLLLQEVEWSSCTRAWKTDGKPADCIKLALGVLFDFKPDLIVSGINHGANSGRNVLYSGTIGAVIEGVLRNVPGIAFSYTCSKTPHFPHVETFIPPIIHYVLQFPLAHGTLLNVNFPDKEANQIKGYKMARQGQSYWMEKPIQTSSCGPSSSYHMEGTPIDYEEHVESDISLLKEGYITAVPIHVHELTDHDHLTAQKGSFETLNRHIPFS